VPTLSRASLAPTADINVKWEQSLLAIGCEAVAKAVNAPPQESRADFIAGKVDRHPGRSHFERWIEPIKMCRMYRPLRGQVRSYNQSKPRSTDHHHPCTVSTTLPSIWDFSR
jgi:hypothetical protein